MYDVVTFGEAMLRLAPPDFLRLEQTNSFNVTIGGSELNSAVGVSRLGLKTAWVSSLPRSPLGRMVANKGREHGVDVSNIFWVDEGRVGVYFLEFGATPRASQVIYDRKDSAISRLKPGNVKWDKILDGTRLFHTSGITPALSESCAEATVEAVKMAKEMGCKISFDLNYRKKLWSPEKARECFAKIFDKVDILITTQFDTEDVYGMKGAYEEVAQKLRDSFGFSTVALTLREVPTVLTGTWSSMVLDGKTFRRGKTYPLEIIDRVGTGDAYTAGFIYGYLTGDIRKAIDYGDALAALCHSVPGDFSWFTEEEVTKQIRATDFKIQR